MMIEPLESRRIVFIDAYGDTGLDLKRSSTNYFIIAAIICPENRVDVLRRKIEKIAAQYFSGGEIKSSNVGQRDERRLKILESLMEVDYHFGGVIIDKAAIDNKSGLIYKKSFIKFCHGLLFSHLFSSIPSKSLLIDEHGSREFMDGFERYVERKHIIPSLFDSYSINFLSSRAERLIQLADFIAGSLARIFDPSRRGARALEIWRLLKPKRLWIEDWPPRRYGLYTGTGNISSENKLIRDASHFSLANFLEQKMDSHDEEVRAQVETLKYLSFVSRAEDEKRYASTEEILGLLRENEGINYSKEKFWRAVIEPLRDEGVIVVSSTKGYKIPVTVEEVASFAKDVNSRVSPQVTRLAIMNNRIKTASNGSIDIMSEYPHLVALLDTIKGNPTV